jgi:SAM-dependent methyltransferase
MDVHKNYPERINDYYSRTDEKRKAQEVLRSLLEGSRFDAILDVGSGPGELAEVLNQHSQALTLLEIEPAFAEGLRKRFPHAHVIESPLEAYDTSHRFDRILLSHVLYYFPESQWIDIIAKLLRLLSPEGRLIVFINSDRGDWWEIIHHFKARLGALSPFYYLPWSQFRSELKTIARIEDGTFYTSSVRYQNLEDIVSFTTKSCLAVGDEKARLAIQSEVEAFLKEKCGVQDKPGALTYYSEVAVLSRMT